MNSSLSNEEKAKCGKPKNVKVGGTRLRLCKITRCQNEHDEHVSRWLYLMISNGDCDQWRIQDFLKMEAPTRGAPTYDFAKISQKIHKIKEDEFLYTFIGGFGGGGVHLARAPLWPKIFSISCSFLEKLGNSYVGAPPPTVGAPSYGESWIRPWPLNLKSEVSK